MGTKMWEALPAFPVLLSTTITVLARVNEEGTWKAVREQDDFHTDKRRTPNST